MNRLKIFRPRNDHPLKQEKFLSTAPVEFIENHVEGASQKGVYDHDQDKFVAVSPPPVPRTPIPADLYSSATNAQLRFVQDIPVPQAQPETENMWDDVYMAIDDAIARYQNHGRIREASRKLGDNAKTIQSWLTLFPNTSYSSTLCGGIKLILDVAERVSKIRGQVLEMLADLPYRIQNVNSLTELYKERGEISQGLHKKSSDLYVAILEAVSLMLGWLNTKAERKFLKALGQGSAKYGQDIEDKLKQIEKNANDIQIEAGLCLHNMVAMTHNGTERNGKAIEEMKEINERNFAQLQQSGQFSDSQLTQILNGQEKALEKMDWGVVLLNSLRELLKDTVKNRPNEKPGIMPIASRKSFAPDKRLVEMLQPRPDPVPNDLKLCYERACSLGTAEKDRVNWALMSQPFKTWIAAPSSHILLINGHSENTFISTMSYLCAFVAESLKLERIPSGMYFCGMRCTHDGYPSGPLELVKSLIVQLISRFDFNFDILDRDRNRPNPERINDGKWLCWLLRHLIKQLPSGTVLFWIVDGVSYFESNRLVADTCLVFQKIVEMVTMRKEIIIKLLMTSPYRSCEVGRQLGSQYILNIPEVPDGERQGTFAMELREASRMVPRPQSAQRTSRWGW